MNVPEIRQFCEEIIIYCPDEFSRDSTNRAVRLNRIKGGDLQKVLNNLRAEGIIPIETVEMGVLDNLGTKFYSVVVYSDPRWWDWLEKKTRVVHQQKS